MYGIIPLFYICRTLSSIIPLLQRTELENQNSKLKEDLETQKAAKEVS